jgi:hypothetical protein
VKATPSLFPLPLRSSGPGAPPTTAGEVAADLPQSLRKNTWNCLYRSEDFWGTSVRYPCHELPDFLRKST